MTPRTLRYCLLPMYGLAFITTASFAASSNDERTLSQLPITQNVGVTPNVLLLLDDSGSMSFEDTVEGGGSPRGYDKLFGYDWRCSSYCNWNSSWKYVFSQYELDKHFFCSSYNSQAYNPNLDYLPWKLEEDGTRADDSDPENALIDYSKGDVSGNRVDLTDRKRGFSYYVDSGNAGSGCSLKYEVSDLLPAQKQNYANWFTYYRDRLSVGKVASLELLTGTQYRTGFMTINPDADTAQQVPVDDIITKILNTVGSLLGSALGGAAVNTNAHFDDVRDAIATSVISSVNSYRGTPLREALYRAGEYYRGDSSPIMSADLGGMCQQNFTILVTDGFWNRESTSGDRTRVESIGDANNDGRRWYYSNGGYGGKTTLADVAYYYANKDLKESLGSGSYENQVMTTYTVAFGVEADDDRWNTRLNSDIPGYVQESTSSTIDDLKQAAEDGGGLYFNAADPAALVDALAAISRDIVARGESVSGVATNLSTAEVEAGGVVLQVSYSPASWSGEVTAVSAVAQGDSDAEVVDSGTFEANQEAPVWNASDRLTANLNKSGAASRKVYTADNGSTVVFSEGNLTSAQQKDLERHAPDDLSKREGREAVVAWLKGSRALEGKGLRTRQGSVLGDIIGSSPVVVTRDGGNGQGSVFVGANDGMLHAFDLESGDEQFAYIPELLFSKEDGEGLGYLASTGYQHRYYVDAVPRVTTLAEGSTWLASGLGGGGRGVFVLNVSDAVKGNEVSAAGLAGWEFGVANNRNGLKDKDVGYVYGGVHVGQLNNGQQALLIPNGLKPENDKASATLFLRELTSGTAIAKLVGGSDAGELTSLQVADLDGNGTIDFAYGGDMQGRMWKFDLSERDPAEWKSSLLFTATCDSDSSEGCASGSVQPITVKPTLSRLSGTTNTMEEPNLLVSFGTGEQLYTPIDDDVASQQSLYTVLDDGQHLDLGREQLEQREFTGVEHAEGEIVGRTLDGQLFDYGQQPLASDKESRYGWYLDLVDAGEEVVQPASLLGNLLVVSTRTDGGGSNFCEANSSGWLIAVDVQTGLPSYDSGNSSYVPIFDLNGDSSFDDGDLIGTVNEAGPEVGNILVSIKLSGEPSGLASIGNHVFVATGASGSDPGTVTPFELNVQTSATSGRVSWYQLR